MSKEKIRAKYQLFNKENQSQFESTISACLESIDQKLCKDDFGNLLIEVHTLI
jgi:HPt (histidine-containing phosphotransfer) domain-containing protein